MRELRQATAQTERIGPFLDATDGVTEETGLTPATEISKDGGAFAAGPSGTHDAEGWYSVAFTTTHTNTRGSLVIKSHDSANHLPVWHEFMVLDDDEYDSKYAAVTRAADVIFWNGAAVAIPTVSGVPEVDLTHWIGTAAATPTVAGVPEVDVTHADGTSGAVNEIAAGIGPRKNQAFSDLEFLMVLSSDGQSPATGLTVTGERSIDGAAFATVSGSIAEVSDGIYQFDADAADMNGATVTFRFSSATALDTFILIKTTP